MKVTSKKSLKIYKCNAIQTTPKDLLQVLIGSITRLRENMHSIDLFRVFEPK
jgi:hypothetical protein